MTAALGIEYDGRDHLDPARARRDLARAALTTITRTRSAGPDTHGQDHAP